MVILIAGVIFTFQLNNAALLRLRLNISYIGAF